MKIVQIFRRSTAAVLVLTMLGGCVLREAEAPAVTRDMPEIPEETEVSVTETEKLPEPEVVPDAEIITEIVTEPAAEIVPGEDTPAEPEILPEPEVVVTPVPEIIPEPEVIPEAEVIPETPEQVRERRISEELAKMTLREKLGQMFMPAYSSAAASQITEYAFGSYILFAADFETGTTDSLSAEMAALQEAAKYGLLTAVDEEGGTVTRISRFTQYRAEKFKSPRTLYSWGGMELIRSDAAEKAALLKSLGMNLNMAPVADISQNESDFMYWRSVGLDAEGTAEFVRTVIRESAILGVGSVAKHFPGYGSVADTHTGMAYDSRSLDELRAKDFVPFAAAVEEGVCAILVSHIITESIDAEKPASVSAKTVALLRDELGYDGIIMTDDLAMAGITDYCTTGNAALEAILAGCDMLCCSNWSTQYPAVWEAVGNGTVTEERLNESAARILRVKYDMALWQ